MGSTPVPAALEELAAGVRGLERRPLKNQLADLLREAIVSGRLAPETRLIERELSELLGVSRLPVRDALNQLEGEGLVVNAEAGRQVINLDEATLRELYAFREALESLAARLATGRLTPAQDARLAAEVDGMRATLASGDLQGYAQHDLRLHELLWRYSGNRFVQREMRVLGRMVMLLAAGGAGEQVLSLHERLVERLLARDAAGAERVIAEHMALSRESCLRVLRGERLTPGA